jgi:excisionase family DNA binding protein
MMPIMSANSHLPSDFPRRAFYTPDELAGLLRVHVSTVREWIRTDRLFAYRLSERISRIPLTSVMEMLGESQPAIHRTLSEDEEASIWERSQAEHAS